MSSELVQVSRTVIVGAGAIGMLFADRLLEHSRCVAVYDINSRANVTGGDATCPSGALASDLAQADWVILALPQAVLATAIPAVSKLTTPASLIVETASTKMPLLETVRASHAHCGILGINPLFGPSLGFANQNVAVVSYRGAPTSAAFIELLRYWGAAVIELTAERHDRLMSINQAAVHCALLALGATIARIMPSASELADAATPPLRAVLMLLGRILRQSPEVYWEIQAQNPFAGPMRELLLENMSRLAQIASQPDGQSVFHRELSALSATLAPLLPSSLAASDAMLATVSRQTPPQSPRQA